MLGMDTVKLQVYSTQMMSKWLTILEDPAYIPKAVHVHIEVCFVVHVLNAAVCKKILFIYLCELLFQTACQFFLPFTTKITSS
jgi:hypothetical protein